jgi:GntR family transcriptional regulator
MIKNNRGAGNPSPVYFKLQKELQQAIERGRWTPGERVPTEKKLAEIYKVSVGTVTKAILNLVNEGFLYRIQGSGTFVAGSTLRFGSIRYYLFLREFGDQEENLRIKLLELKSIKGVEAVNRYLKIEPTQGLFQLKRVLFSGERPAVYSISYLPQKMLKGFENFAPGRFEKNPLYMTIEESYRLPTILNQELLSAIPAQSEAAKALNIEEGAPVLLAEMLAFTYKERPYEYRRSYCLTGEKKIYRVW